ncbi:hypothetical protein JOC58_001780 [Paenibacillus hunanensis]|uniref:Uncharacterized protein n=1 Tax=Paenibacillus hunanensis TaxID=539262 RepID=A0ABU1IX99_9BACL|nr:hypothetical protein [Paenibacillus hunanensis]
MGEKWAYSGLKVGLLASLPVLRSVLDVGMWCLRERLVNGGRLGNDGGGAEFMHLRFNFICLQLWRVGSLHIDLV